MTTASRPSKWIRTVVQGAMASALVVVGLVSFSTVASPDAANPTPTTTGTLTPNADGTVTANLSGNWTWDQACGQRYGEGYSVDWWGISTSSTPSPNFSVTNATEVNPPGTTTTGTVSQTGTIGLPGPKFFHTSTFLSGENINSASTCTDTVVSGHDTSSGAWSASATYPSVSDVPAQLCVNMYDLHSLNMTGDWSPTGNGDNSIQKNAFDPTVGNGFCTQLRLVNIPTTTATNVSAGSVTLGPSGSVTDNVTVTGTAAGGLPAGSVAFYVCGPTASNAVCTSTANAEGTAALPAAANTGFVSTGSSSSFIPTHAGTYCFAAVYTPSSGSPYAASSDNNTGNVADNNECVSVGAASSTTATSLSANSITLGPSGSVTDHVTVTGTANAGLPTGNVKFYVCGPSGANAVCTSTATSEGTATLPAPGDTGSVSTGSSSTFTPTQAGTWCFAAVFTPTNANYSSSSDNNTGNIADNNECVSVGAASSTTATSLSANSITLGPSGSVTDHVTVTGTANAGLPTGTVKFYVCGPSGANAVCTSTATSEGTATLPAAGDTGSVSTGSSSTFTPTQAGTWCFAAVFTPTNANYASSSDNNTGNIADNNECVNVSAAPSGTATQASSSSITIGASGSVTDSVTVTGTANGGLPTGTVKFYVCGPTAGNALCTSTANAEGTANLPSGTDTGFVSHGTSSAFSPQQVGTYCFAAVFTPSNGNYLGSSDNNTAGQAIDANECFTVGSAPDVTVVKTSNPATGTTVIPGQIIGYTLTASNSGTEASGQEVISDPIPSGAAYVANSANCSGVSGCTAAFDAITNTVTFTITSVAGLATGLVMTFNVTVNGNATVAIDNVATITTGCTANCSSNHTHNPVAAFSTVKSSNPASGTTVVPGQTIAYTLTAANAGDGATGQEVVTDPIPSGTTYVAGSASCGTVPSCMASFANNKVTFTLTSVAPGTSGLALTFSVTVNTTATTAIDNVATITGPGCNSDHPCPTNHTNNPVAVFNVVKSSNPASGTTVIAGQTIAYTLTASNAGDGPTGQEIVTDQIPGSASYVAGSASCGTVPNCTASFASNTVTFTLTSVDPGTSGLALTFSATVNANATVAVNNVATITGPGCSTGCSTNHTNNPVAVFSVVKSASPASGSTVSAGQTITYTLTAANAGDGVTGQEVVTDGVPANSTYVAGSASCGTVPSCTASFASNTVTFTLSSVAAHSGPLALTFKVTVNNNPTGTTIVNQASITGPGCNSDHPCTTNQTTHTVLNPPVLTVNKVGCAAKAIPGEVFFYTITFSNTGGGDSTNTVLTDILPPASQAIVNNPGGGTVTTVGGQPALVWNLGTVAAHTSGSETVKFIVTGTSGSIVNTATIASSNAAVTTSTTSTVTTPISSAGAITHGSAYAAEVDLLGIPLIHQLGFTSSVAPGTPQTSSNQVIPTIGLGSLLSLGLIDQNSTSSIGLTATSTASSQIAGISLLNGAITADVIRAQSNSTAEASGSNHGSGGSNYVNLKVNGVAQSTVAPNTALAITLGKLTVAKVVLNEDTGSIITSGGLTRVTDAVNMVDITLLAPLGALPIGAHIIIGHAQTDATFPAQNPACGTTPGSVSGYAFTAYAHATLLNSQLINAIVDNVSLPATGGGSAVGVNGTFITGLAASGTATDTTSGSLSPNPHSASDSRIQGLNLLNGLITADVVDAGCASTTIGPGGNPTTVLGTTFVNLKIAGIPVTVNIGPNATLSVPFNGSVIDLVLNEQSVSNGPQDTTGTVSALHLYVLNHSGLVSLEVILASAHCDAHTGLAP